MNESPGPWTRADVPPGPYYHGSRVPIAVGAELDVETVDPAAGDDRRVAWATTSYEEALGWARRRNPQGGGTLYVYEVELDDPEVDINVHYGRANEEVISVMAGSGRVIALVSATPVQDRSVGGRSRS